MQERFWIKLYITHLIYDEYFLQRYFIKKKFILFHLKFFI